LIPQLGVAVSHLINLHAAEIVNIVPSELAQQRDSHGVLLRAYK